MMIALLLAGAMAATGPTVEPTPASSGSLPTQTNRASEAAAMGLFEKDWVLMGWALKRHDLNHDALLEPAEAAGAAVEFRDIADGDRDGRVSRLEYSQARAFIVARY